jgi:hypothetical protein
VDNGYVKDCEVLVGGEVLKVELVRIAIEGYDLIFGIGLVVNAWYPRCCIGNPRVCTEEVSAATLRFIARISGRNSLKRGGCNIPLRTIRKVRRIYIILHAVFHVLEYVVLCAILCVLRN